MKKRIFASMCAIALASVVLVAGLVIAILYNNLDDNTWKTLRNEAEYIAAGIEENGLAYVEKVKAVEGRITVVQPDGTVLYDESEEAGLMDNHLNRPEIAQAFATGAGEAQRTSSTFHQKSIYYALLMKDGNVLRISTSMDSAVATLFNVLPALVVVCALAVVLALLLARWLTQKIVAPINTVNLDAPLSNDVYGELSPLLRRIEKLKGELNEQMSELRARQREFVAVTENLREGMVVLNDKGVVLSINESAKQILGVVGQNYVNQPLLALNRNLLLSQVVDIALAGTQQDEIMELKEEKYHLMASPIKKGELTTGAVLLFMNVTETQAAEEMRREFSANVSHELKTPLTSISGYAEIMKNGLASPNDMPEFATRIYNEANGVIALVDDIIKLSRLDEEGKMPARQMVNVYKVASDVVARLQPMATGQGVQLTLAGQPAFISGVEGLLQEVVYNLCENAIKYNKQGGRVTVEVLPGKAEVLLRVQDTGIGIPQNQQNRVFERFYRVDKSHSKGTGGTGLGLSIVKHGVLYHNGTIELQSTEGQGTTVTVRLPA
ncbi:PAS domain-containing protein [Ruminococcaceae bacterium OttesenSCG-928-A16]|nr:PAS domain-containing protein [Ruminococcaceae bacterium OttesenSCG-928-A16]